MYDIHVILLWTFKIIVLRIDSMNQKQMDDVFDKVCKAWNNQDFNKKDVAWKQKVITKSMTCKHDFTKYDTLCDNSRQYYCAKCGLCE
jgi:hypothetical protein